MHKFSRLLTAFVLSVLALSAYAQAATETTIDNGYAMLDRFFANLTSLQASFTQSVRDSRERLIESSAGTLAIKKPGKFRWDYAQPNAQIIVSDGARIWLYDPELEQVTIRRAELSLNGTPAMLLSGQGNLRDSFEVEHVEQRDGMMVINLSPRKADTDFRLLQLALRKDQLVAMSLTDKLSQTTLLQFTKFKRNAALADSQFSFVPPKGVDVIDNSGSNVPGTK
ncbi:MAG: outer membrane lipoprotein chaperone LolA [Steroidobacteraceae bacterium]